LVIDSWDRYGDVRPLCGRLSVQQLVDYLEKQGEREISMGKWNDLKCDKLQDTKSCTFVCGSQGT
jgi:hypothetical protein